MRLLTLENRNIKIDFTYNMDDWYRIRSLKNVTMYERESYSIPYSEEVLNQLQKWKFDISEDLKRYVESERERKKNFHVTGLKGILRPFQNGGVSYLVDQHGKGLITDEMGCLSGESIITFNRAKKGFKMKLSNAYLKFNNLVKRKRYTWDLNIPTMTQSLNNGELRLNEVVAIKSSGIKNVVKVKTKNGKELILTPDHEVITDRFEWKSISSLRNGDKILTNGIPHCPLCNSTENIVTYKYSKFLGYCKQCVVRKLRVNGNYKTGRFVDKDGYVRVSGCYDHHRIGTRTYTYEHILVMEEHLGRKINLPELVHHKNGNKQDNSIENLELTTVSGHGKIHRLYQNFGYFTPKIDTIVSIEDFGMTDTYDIVMKEPGRNFVANGIIVHNCGKTCQSIGYIHLNRDKIPVVIICPSSIKLNWKSELETWLDSPNVEILKGTRSHKTNGDILIINYDIVSCWTDELKRRNPQIMILDEFTRIKNSKTIRTKAILKLKMVPHIIGLSGTPIENRPEEIYIPGKLVRPDLFGTFEQFKREYCNGNGFGHEFNGTKETHLLNFFLISNKIMIRRLKKDVLSELPEKTYSFVPMELDNWKDYREAENDLVAWLRREKGQIVHKKVEALARFETLKQLATKGKMNQIKEWIKDFLETGNKLVLFCTHTFVVDELMTEFGDISVRLDGKVHTDIQRQRAKDMFQNDEKIKLFIGNILSASEGVTLTASSNVAILELPWKSSAVDQAGARVDRITQKFAVTIYYLLAQNTVEEKIAKLLDKKRKMIASAMNGTEAEQSELLVELINSYK